MTQRNWDAEQTALIRQLDQLDMDWDLRLQIQRLVLRWFADQREADRRWALRAYGEAG